MHSFLYNATCFKYRAAVIKKCKFGFPCLCITETKVRDLGSIEISQNNPYVNSWNPILTSLIRSNPDINFIPSNIKALTFIRYIINYTIKADCSQCQCVIDTTFVQNTHNKTMQQYNMKNPGNQPYTIKLDKFSLCTFNRLIYNYEISKPLAANTILGPLEFYILEYSLEKLI